MIKLPIRYTIVGRGIVFRDNKLLLVSTDGSDWHLPGGMIDDIEPVENACIRELYEEAGIVVKINSFATVYEAILKMPEHGNFLRTITMCFHCDIVDDSAFGDNWIDPDDNLIKYRKFFNKEEYGNIPPNGMFRFKFDEYRQLNGKHVDYINFTGVESDKLYDSIDFSDKKFL
jgi:ADP-ribose pyrophosphatase YjhB (NUDIX family)